MTLSDLLVKIEDVDSAFLVSHLDVAEVFLEFDVDHLLCDGAVELIRVNVDFYFGLFVAPGKLLNFLLGNGRLGLGLLRSLVCRVSLDKHGIASVNLAVLLEVHCAFC